MFVQDGINNYELTSEEITYNKKKEELFSTGKTEAIIESKYNFEGENILFLLKSKQLSSESKIKIFIQHEKDLNGEYNLDPLMIKEVILSWVDKDPPKPNLIS